LTWEEFEDLTPSQFNALTKRRNVRFKHERFANALTAAAVYNVNRTSAETPTISAWDFIRTVDPAQEQRDGIKKMILKVVGDLPCDTPRAKLLELRAKVVNSLTAQGCKNGAGIWAECWPALVPDLCP
jgi:hypothetical protein